MISSSLSQEEGSPARERERIFLSARQPPHKVLVRAMRNVTEPTRPSSALLTIPSSLLPPLLLSRLPSCTAHSSTSSSSSSSLLVRLLFSLLISSLPSTLLGSFVAYRSRPDLTRDLYSPRNDLRRHFSSDSRGTKDNQDPLTRRPILLVGRAGSEL